MILSLIVVVAFSFCSAFCALTGTDRLNVCLSLVLIVFSDLFGLVLIILLIRFVLILLLKYVLRYCVIDSRVGAVSSECKFSLKS